MADIELVGLEARACAAVVLYMPDPDLLQKQAKSLSGMPFLVYVNGPLADAARAVLVEAELRTIESPANLGLGHGLNAVMAAASDAGFTHVLLLDQDSEPTASMLLELMTKMHSLVQADEKVAVVAPLLVPPEGERYKPIRYNWRGPIRTDGLAAVDFTPTSGSLVSVAAWHEVGPFRDDFFIAGIDVEWGFRAWSKGFSSLVAKDLQMPHRWGESGDADTPQILRQSKLRNYYYTRNVVAVSRIAHVPLGWRARSLLALGAQIGILALKGERGALSPAVSGLRDGILNRLGPAPTDF